MGKLTTYLGIIITAILLFYFAGVGTYNTISGLLLNALLHPDTLQNYSYINIIVASLSSFAGIAGSIVIGSLFPQRFEQAVTIGFVSFLLTIGWELGNIFLALKHINDTMAVLIMSPLMFLYVLSAYEWWRGKD